MKDANRREPRRSRPLRMILAVLAVVPAWSAPPLDAQSQRALLDKYCLGCHNQKLKTAGISVEGADLSQPASQADLWERVIRKVRSGQMPPPGLPHPDKAVATSFANSVEESLDKASAAHPNPGRMVPHRLNRAEYSNAIRDLLALDIKPGELLPVDDSGYGFDNIAGLLSMSPALLERYLSAARTISRLAVGDPQMKPVEERFSIKEMANTNSDELPFDSRGGFAFRHYFPLDAEYVLKVGVGGGDNASSYEFRLPVKAGLRTVGATFLKESAKLEAVSPAGRRGPALPGGGAPPAPAQMDLRLDGAKIKRFEVPQRAGAPEIGVITILGPYNATGRGDTPSRSRIFVCRPAAAKEEDACAHTILANLTRRAFRRPVVEADLRPLLAFYQTGRKEGDFDHGIEMAIQAALISPDFLFRIEHEAKGATPDSIYRINDYELASRLSFFLWSSIPDDELLKLAEQGKLKDPAILQAQVHRLLDDPKSDALVNNFGGQWLYLRNLATAKPDADIFPEFDENLRQSFRRETELFVRSIFREDRSIFDLLSANYSFLNERLAEHYGIPGVYGSQFRRVVLTNPQRGGLLGQGSILTVTSNPNRTSVVVRGKWILENLLGTPPPPPPPDVPELKPQPKEGKHLTLRQQMEEHRANTICASCHSRMDPLGFALENYDGVGKWRTEDGGNPIDATGKLPNGAQFQGPEGLRKILLSNYQSDFADTVTEKLLTYGLGRGLDATDKPFVRSIMKQAARDNYRVSALIMAIVQSTPFQMRRTSEP